MRIKQIIQQYRRDFSAIIECEHCENQQQLKGYDDENFHRNVIPTIECQQCGEVSPPEYRPLTTKYPDGVQL